MIFDIHSHILPGVDDGAKDMDVTKRMLQVAAEEGIDAIVATPHFACGMKRKYTEKRKEIFETVREWWKQEEPNRAIYLGNELLYSEGIVDALEAGTALTMNDTQYVLVEFPVYVDFLYVEKAIRNLQYAGYSTIIAHVERYEHMQERGKLRALTDMWAYLQVNASTVTGTHGLIAQHRTMRYLKEGLIHFVATDAHSARVRKPEISGCAAYLERKLGERKARRILEENPSRMLRGEELYG